MTRSTEALSGQSPAEGQDVDADAMYSRLSERMFGEPTPPPHIGRFRILRRIGAGGMGVVYEADDPTMGRRVAVKVLHSHGPHHPEWLHREARALARLSHPNVVHAYEVGTYRGALFIAMEYVDGVTLAQWQAAERRGWREVVGLYAQAGRALAAAHRAGLVHRDFKPSNALVDGDGRVKVLDFGLARGLDHATTEAVLPAHEAAAEPATASGGGTPAFMSPEQIRREPVGPASDQFSFCVALFQALAGELPFAGATLDDRMQAIGRGPRALPGGCSAPRWLRRTLRRGLDPDPARRFASMERLVHHLETASLRRRRAWAIGGVSGVAAAAFVAWPSLADPLCTNVDALEGVWDEPVRETIREAFEHTGLPEAPAAAGRVLSSLDGHAERWESARATVCDMPRDDEPGIVATHHDRLACLDDRRQELATLAGLLARVDPDVVPHAQAMVSELRPAEDCLRTGRSHVPPPPPSIAIDVMSQRATMLEARFLRSSGRYDEARARLERVDAAARILGHAPLLAEVLIERARLEDRAGNREHALELLGDAVGVALASGHADAEVDARLLKARVLINPLERIDEAVVAATEARSGASKLLPDPHRDGQMHLVLGMIAEERGDAKTARRELERALASFRMLPGAELDVAEALIVLGNVASLEVRPDDAASLYGEVLALRTQILGPEHPLVGEALYNLATVEVERGNPEAAERAYEQALEIMQASERQGSFASEIAGIRIGLADLANARGAPRRALELAEVADAQLATAGYARTHTQRIAAREALCNAHQGLEDLKAALACHRLLLGLHAAGATELELVSLHINIGSNLVELGWDREAQAHYEDVLPELHRALEQADRLSLLGVPLYTYAESLARTGDTALAAARLEQARVVLGVRPVTALEPELAALVEETAADVAWALARSYGDAGRAGAEALAREALAYYGGRGDPTGRVIGEEIMRWLGASRTSSSR